MVGLYRLQSAITGLAGGTGLSTFHFLASAGSGADAQASVDAFWNALESVMHVSLSVASTGELVTFEDTTGEASSFTPVTGETHPGVDANSELPAATQGLIRWSAGGVVAGRRVQGRTYIPGATEANSGTDGLPQTPYRTALDNAAAALLASVLSTPVVWSRPVTADPEANPPIEGRLGSSHQILSGAAWTQWAVLRGRRDA
jgi:hypothetical protein